MLLSPPYFPASKHLLVWLKNGGVRGKVASIREVCFCQMARFSDQGIKGLNILAVLETESGWTQMDVSMTVRLLQLPLLQEIMSMVCVFGKRGDHKTILGVDLSF